MKLLFYFLFSFMLISCSKDDLSWQTELESIKKELSDQKKIIESLQSNAKITSASPLPIIGE